MGARYGIPSRRSPDGMIGKVGRGFCLDTGRIAAGYPLALHGKAVAPNGRKIWYRIEAKPRCDVLER